MGKMMRTKWVVCSVLCAVGFASACNADEAGAFGPADTCLAWDVPTDGVSYAKYCELFHEQHAEKTILQKRTLELFEAIREGNMDGVRQSIKACALVNLPYNQYGWSGYPHESPYHKMTPLEFAVKQGDIEIVRLLIEAGADVNQKNDDGQVPLEVAVKANNLNMVRCLVFYGADVQAKASFGRTFLWYAVENALVDIGAFLIQKGASVE